MTPIDRPDSILSTGNYSSESSPLSPGDLFIQNSRDILFVRCKPGGEILDTNSAFRRKFYLSSNEDKVSLFSFLSFDSKETTTFELGSEKTAGQPILFRDIEMRQLFLFHVYQRSGDFFLFGLNQELPETKVTELLSSLTADLGNLLREENRTNRKLAEAYTQIEVLSHTDGLTGLLNHVYFMLRSDETLRHAKRHSRPLCLVMIDIDHFKRINDKFGHPTGDKVLVLLGETLNKMTRAGDFSARYGGEEFATLLQDSSLQQAMQFAQRMRKTIEASCPMGADHPVTVSLGIAEYQTDDSLESLVKRADNALYDAKNAGRNRVCVA